MDQSREDKGPAQQKLRSKFLPAQQRMAKEDKVSAWGEGGTDTFSSVPSKSFRRNDSTQSLKHFSTSELYIRKLRK